ncbi:hypothetical protein PENCOP_c005G08134 [Penicillium coprophilum]|uniref:Fe2OG dioxygenase domain-containing protein n=1 Tax=Penicillium coprophilum TaxID=36646 RepID=A0A1V6US70_9EURO|nr:hypothetical protein PENCOP_c005G08134 [Penicillium coprophilum]
MTLEYTQVELLTLSGPEFRRVSTAPPRPPTEDEIPIIDLAFIDRDLEARKIIASKVRAAAENTGFFYIKNHGISEELIERALSQAKAFFDQPIEKKQLASSNTQKNPDGWQGLGSSQINKTETRDRKETFSLRYNLSNDPSVSDPDTLTTGDGFSWDTTSHLPGFQETTIEFFQSRLTLARKIIRIFALALGMPEDYFDEVITNPGADGLYTHYPAAPVETPENNEDVDVGIGSHTDIHDEWLDARPIPGTMVVNIGDLLQRLSNNRFKSTVHRVYNRQPTSRYSMPFFLGFNPDSVCEVVPSCIDEAHPALYGPVSSGKWHRNRLELAHGKPISD